MDFFAPETTLPVAFLFLVSDGPLIAALFDYMNYSNLRKIYFI